MLFLQVLHATVVKQLEISKLLDDLRESKRRVSIFYWFFQFNFILNIIKQHWECDPSDLLVCNEVATPYFVHDMHHNYFVHDMHHNAWRFEARADLF